MSSLVTIILPVFLVIAGGYLATRTKLLSVTAVGSLMSFTTSVAFPCLLFSAVSKFDIAKEFHLPLLGSFYLAATVSFFVGILGARLIGREPADAVVIGFCCLFSNSMMLGVPITERAFGTDAVGGNFAIIAVHAPYCYTLGIITMELMLAGKEGLAAWPLIRRIVRQILRNPLVIALILGFIVNLSGLKVPDFLGDSIEMVGRAALPCALFAVGGMLVQYKIEGDWRLIGLISSASLLIHPGLTWAFGRAFHLDLTDFRSAVLTAACAPGVNTYVFATLYERGKRSAASSLLIATGFCLFTMWFWLSVLP